MANKVQMTPMVTQETRDLVRRTCQEKGCSQGDLVENALLAFLGPAFARTVPQLMTRHYFEGLIFVLGAWIAFARRDQTGHGLSLCFIGCGDHGEIGNAATFRDLTCD